MNNAYRPLGSYVTSTDTIIASLKQLHPTNKVVALVLRVIHWWHKESAELFKTALKKLIKDSLEIAKYFI